MSTCTMCRPTSAAPDPKMPDADPTVVVLGWRRPPRGRSWPGARPRSGGGRMRVRCGGLSFSAREHAAASRTTATIWCSAGSGSFAAAIGHVPGGTPTHHENRGDSQSDFLSNPVPGARGRRGSRACPARDAPAEVDSPEGAVEAPPVYILTPAFSQSSRKRLRPMSVSGCFRSIWNTAKGRVATSAPATAASTTCSGLRSDAARIWVSKS
jgi:hypothetical protein